MSGLFFYFLKRLKRVFYFFLIVVPAEGKSQRAFGICPQGFMGAWGAVHTLSLIHISWRAHMVYIDGTWYKNKDGKGFALGGKDATYDAIKGKITNGELVPAK